MPPPSGGVLAVDFDGPDAPAKFQEAYGRPATDLPPTVGVTSGKPCRGQRLFQVDPDWWPHMRGRHVWKQNGEVCLELRWAGHQSVIAGAHPETKGYSWLPQSSPAERVVAIAPEWLLEPLLRSEAHAEAIEPSSDDAKRAIAMLQHIDPLSRTDYDSWLEVGMALFHTDPGLLAEWVSWSRAMPNFDEAECLSKWESFDTKTGSRLTIRSLHHWAKAGGYQEPKRARPQQPVVSLLPATSETTRQCKDQPGQTEKLEALLGPEQEGRLRKPTKDLLSQVIEAVVPLRFNQLTNRIENDGQPVDGDFLGTLYLQLAERYAIDVQKERAADAALLVSRRHSFHPVRLYLQNLESQSTCLPAEDWAALDARIFGGEVSGGWGIVHLQRQLIAAVARAMQPGCEVHTALVLHSDQQGIGKSSLWKILGGAWFSDSLGDLKDLKEDRLQLHSAWIHEWGEIDAVMGKRDSETLKRFLSCNQDDVRRPYGRGTEQLKRSCVIVGTTNRRDFIKDPTGNRRFPIISIRQVNTRWIKEHRDAIWGSALAAYKAGDRWHYNDQEIAQINDAALAFAAEDPLRDQIETWAEDHPDIREAPLARILPEAGCTPSGEPPDQKLVQRASTVMRCLGWRRADKKRRYLLPNGDRTDNTWGWLRDAA